MLRWLLNKKSIRDKILFHIKQNYFYELEISIPTGSEYWAHLLENDSYDSFSEIFIKQEYKNLIPQQPVSRILDIGAHYGYFSLWYKSQSFGKNVSSLMVEASPRCIRSLNYLTNQAKLIDKFSYLQGCIGSPSAKSSKFYDNSHMGGSTHSRIDSKEYITIPNIHEEQLIRETDPFDLIKCDIEGSEWDFLCHYSKIIRSAKFILLEWHSWHNGGGGMQQIFDKLVDYNYQIIKSSTPSKSIGREGEVGLILAQNTIL